MTMQMKDNLRLTPHQWLDVQRASLDRERQFQRSQSFTALGQGPDCGTDGPRMKELARTSSWARWPHAQYGATWAPRAGEEEPVQRSAYAARDEESRGFYEKWMKQTMPFPPLGVKPEIFLGAASPSAGSSPSLSSSGASTPSGAGPPGGLRRRWPPTNAPPTITYKRLEDIPKPTVPHPGERLGLAVFRDPVRAHRSAAAANTPKQWEIHKDWDAGQGWADRSTKSAERLGLIR